MVAVMSSEDSAEYLQSLEAIREKCQKLMEKAKEDCLECFSLDLTRLPDVADFVVKLIERDYGPFSRETLKKIPPHGRWLHFGPGRVENLIEAAGADKCLASVLDLFVIAVLLDAGAGDEWKYIVETTGECVGRSEGLALASYYMFMDGVFSSDPTNPLQVDAVGLSRLTLESLSKGMQASESNPLVGLEGRFKLLKNLGEVIFNQSSPYFVGVTPRPSNFIQFLQSKAKDNSLDINYLWEVVIKGFGAVWPSVGAEVNGVSLGDAWEMSLDGEKIIVPFHKLSQWLTYSLMLPISKLSSLCFVSAEKMTGLPEYRNGGLFVDLGVLTLKPSVFQAGLSKPQADKDNGIPAFNVNEQAIVEWRALTVCLLDLVADELRGRLGATTDELTLPMVLEAGTWKAGREAAAKLRPATKNPPISIISDGTVF